MLEHSEIQAAMRETFTFTDNRGIHKYLMTLTAAELAKHLAKDVQFMFYWRKGWDPRLNAMRSLYANPPSEKAYVSPSISEAQWEGVAEELRKLEANA